MSAFVLHNLIICIESDNFDKAWRDGLVQKGLGYKHANGDDEEDDLNKPENNLECT